MPFTLPDLPYAKDALAPYLSKETLEYHHDKHHSTYVTNLNTLTAGAGVGDDKLEEVILSAEGPTFNNAAQVWNHSFYWKCMKPGGGGVPSGGLAEAITRDFGSYEQMAKQLTEAAVGQFGSGWAWLVRSAGALKVLKTSNADLPLKQGMTALLAIDVWEHAYYVDYRNARAKYVEAFLGHLVDWQFVAANYAAAK
jgi:Fe-Mn family superoxide dismutase